MAILVYALFALLIRQLESKYLRSDTIYEVTAFNSHERSILYELELKNYSVIFLNGITNEAAMPIQIIVNKCCLESFEHKLQYEGLEYRQIDELSSMESVLKPTVYNILSNGFMTWEQITKWIETQQKKHSNFKNNIIGHTYEQRELTLLSVLNNPKSPAVVLVGGEQGNDWISSSVILSFITSILEDTKYRVLLDYFNFYFIPLLNPDGYVYSMEKDSFWSKNRKTFFPKKICEFYMQKSKKNIAVGVNIERNWYFGETLGPGDGKECSPIYLGNKPLSEEETSALADFLNIHATQIMAFIGIKGFGGRLITVPYSDRTLETNNHGVLMEILMAACEKVHEKYNSTYHQGTTGNFFYNVSGNSADWIKNKLNIPIVSTIYLKYQEEYFPHKSQIQPLSQELTTIINEILMISKEIYGPLFNYQVNLRMESKILVITLSTMLLN